MAARDKLVSTTIDLMRRQGVAGTGVAAIVENSAISRRSVYVNFPEGKSALVAEATRVAGAALGAEVARFNEFPTPAAAIESFVVAWKRLIAGADFKAGCPIVAAALGRSEAPLAADIAGDVFTDWHQTLAAGLQRHRIRPEQAESLAIIIIAAIEGAVITSLATRSLEPLDAVNVHLPELITLHSS
ncbi:TetR/AcrR family transcriptional regulator [Gordonia sp. CPCC 205333]|uniref:TetR/AcrR family transcriptional regulator n=1 Tax=Gordonia sp. CPCC 205333 TaxID=3140790 RepID=UPI003AF39D2A